MWQFIVFLVSSVFGCSPSDMGSKNYFVRDTATKNALRSLPYSLPAAYEGTFDKDPEIAWRCQSVFDRSRIPHFVRAVPRYWNYATMLERMTYSDKFPEHVAVHLMYDRTFFDAACEWAKKSDVYWPMADWIPDPINSVDFFREIASRMQTERQLPGLHSALKGKK